MQPASDLAALAPGGVSLPALLVGGVLALIAGLFLLRFVLPALALGRRLRAADAALARLAAEGAATPETIAARAMSAPPLSHLWREYAQTLHAERAAPGAPPGRWRATALAETFFTEHALVDTPLSTEFYKHLPGILTGLGILGTFFGLIGGLADFAVSSDAQAVRESLNALVHGVGEAFRVSAAAIGLAMAITWLEKSLVTARYREVTRLTQRIDALFEAAAGEEYLERLVHASEASARQAEALRDGLIASVQQAFDALLARQQEALQKQQQALAAAVTRAVVDGLREPLARVAGALEESTRRQGDAVGAQLGDALRELLAESARARAEERAAHAADWRATGETLAAAIGRLGQTAERLDAAAQHAGEAITRASALAGAQSGALAEAVGADLRRLAEDVRAAGAATRQNASQLAESGAGGAQAIAEAVAALRTACGELASASRGISACGHSLNAGAERIEAAGNRFAGIAGDLAGALSAQGGERRDLAALAGELRLLLDAARREATLSTTLVDRLEAGASQLAGASVRATDYLERINAVLEEAHAAFARGLERALREGNRQFQAELAEAVGHLRTVVEELGDVCEAALAQGR